MRNVGNWVGELTTTSGTGAITLGGKLGDQYATFADVGITSVEYAIVDGDNREAGLGTIAGGILTRDTVFSTIFNGIYSGNSPGPISLSGLAEVYSTFNKTAYDEMNAAVARVATMEDNSKDDQIASEVVSSAFSSIVATDVQAAIEEVHAEIVAGGIDTTANFNWTGTNAYTIRTTVNGNTVYDEGNINEAVLGVVADTTTAYTSVLSDAGGLVTMDNAAANTFTVPPNASVAYPIGTVLTVRQKGAGQTTIVEGAGVTITAATSKGLLISEQGEWASIVKEGTDAWSIAGGLTA